MDDDASAIMSGDAAGNPLQPLEDAITEALPRSPGGGSPSWNEASHASSPGGDIDPHDRADLERKLDAAIASGDSGVAAAIKAKLMGIAPFNPDSYGLRRVSTLSGVGATRDDEVGPFFRMHRANQENADLARVIRQYAVDENKDPRALSGSDMDAVRSRYTQLVVDNRVGTYKLFDGNGDSSWQGGGSRLTVYTPDGDYGIGSPNEAALQALQEAGYRELKDDTHPMAA